MDILYHDEDAVSSDDRAIALAVLAQAFEDIASWKDKLKYPEWNPGAEALEWVRRCGRTQGEFGYYVGMIGRQPEALREIVNRWVARGCAPLKTPEGDGMESDDE